VYTVAFLRGVGGIKMYLPYNKNLVPRANELRKNMTLAEKKLWYEYLRDFKYRVHRQRTIDNFIVDFYCPQLKLVIEIDGDSHYTENAQEYDIQRTKILQGYGLKVIRFHNHDVLDNLAGVVTIIEGYDPP
jgi:very-short-patch-repair endonuclease